MEAYIVTGASKGIGQALCRQLNESGQFVIGIARSKSEGWSGGRFLAYDLSDLPGIPQLMADIAGALPEDIHRLALINNAGTVEPIGFSDNNDPAAIQANINLNLTAPMILSSAFIGQFKGLSCEKAIVNISSGAGRKVYQGWSAYCAAKAGLDHFTRVIDAEAPEFKVVSVAPGIIDTGMQEQIRNSNVQDFPLLSRFQDYKKAGKLSTAEETAEKLIRLMNRQDFRSLDPVLDLRELPPYEKEGMSDQ
ncbi:SDR family NAD(P)-dependent oxidoreductase [Planomicrobium sp. CPCC 101110]|uniref:SDR family NAD(P)-dependent oxidoreductase n=1 Tax=Planomicrobium sp. CPCC 101110 TaxID=2599619 RepID=UPI0011B4316A|nr:SDR family NAD(P)-dependent oxidoreductase [Planomicrobium sp. CPCC 101110]TWT28358.1 SDR family NAD(P)-dependent oxidoreductase [Planomicrobium sp. CPCC 101110]